MGWSKNDPILTKNLYKFRGYKANKLMKEFLSKQWNKTILNYFLNIWKNIVLLLDSAGAAAEGCEQFATSQQDAG